MQRHTMTDHLIRWFVLSLAGVAWLVLMPHRALGEGRPLVAGAQELTLVQGVGALVLTLAWLGFMQRVLQRLGVWRGDPACVALVVLVVLCAVAAVVSAVLGDTAFLTAALGLKVAAMVAVAVRVDRLADNRRLRFPGLNPSVRGTPPAP